MEAVCGLEHLFLYCLSFPLRNMAERSRPIYTQRRVPLQLWRGARLRQIEAGRKEQHALPCAVRWSANTRGPNQIALVTLARLLPFYLPALAKSREGVTASHRFQNQRRLRETSTRESESRPVAAVSKKRTFVPVCAAFSKTFSKLHLRAHVNSHIQSHESAVS